MLPLAPLFGVMTGMQMSVGRGFLIGSVDPAQIGNASATFFLASTAARGDRRMDVRGADRRVTLPECWTCGDRANDSVRDRRLRVSARGKRGACAVRWQGDPTNRRASEVP